MNINPRNTFLSIMLAGIVAVAGSACSPGNSGGSSGESTSTEQADCDFDDLLEGDSDCNGQAGVDAERKLTRSQKAKLKKQREKNFKPAPPAPRTQGSRSSLLNGTTPGVGSTSSNTSDRSTYGGTAKRGTSTTKRTQSGGSTYRGGTPSKRR